MANASCPDCGSDVKFDVANAEINLYIQTECNHLALQCPKRHSFNLFSNMHWLEDAQQQLRGRRFNIKLHGNAPTELQESAKRAWRRQPMFDSFDKELDFFGDTGIMF
ncbi:MAG: hypothetical protein NVSMB39_4570 [Candidatus Saccharimonadales bacterium]